MTIKQKIVLGVAALLLLALLAGILFYMRRPVTEPEGLLVYERFLTGECRACFGGIPWHSR